MKKIAGLFLMVVLLAVSARSFQSEIKAFFKLEGDKLILPDPQVYRTWELAGVGMIPNDQNRNRAIFPGVHLVYVDPIAFKHRRERGFFPDGTIMVMDNIHQSSKEGVSGIGYFETGSRDVLVSIKDRRVFTGSGWSYYLFRDKDIKNGTKSVSAMPKSDCQACHISAAGDDEVFVDFYPKLKKIKRKANTSK